MVPGLSAVEEAGRGARAPGGLGSRAASSSSGCGLMSISSCRSCWPRLWTEQVCSQPRAAMSSYVWGHSWWLGPCLKPCPLLWQHGLGCFLSRVWQGPRKLGWAVWAPPVGLESPGQGDRPAGGAEEQCGGGPTALCLRETVTADTFRPPCWPASSRPVRLAGAGARSREPGNGVEQSFPVSSLRTSQSLSSASAFLGLQGKAGR